MKFQRTLSVKEFNIVYIVLQHDLRILLGKNGGLFKNALDMDLSGYFDKVVLY